MRAFLAALCLACVLSFPSEIKAAGDQWDILRPKFVEFGSKVRPKAERRARHRAAPAAASRRVKPKQAPPREIAPPSVAQKPNILKAYGAEIAKRSVSLSGVVPQLAAKAREIVETCGSKVISAVRNTRVRGSGRISLHASGRAVDLAGNPSCIQAMTRGWPGGMSTDYSSVRPVHYHLSYGGREHGKRFAHYTGRHARRYAKSYQNSRVRYAKSYQAAM